MTAATLSGLTHIVGSAWSKAGKKEAVLDNELLKECIVIEEGRNESSDNVHKDDYEKVRGSKNAASQT
ncbi:hypothetical protein Q6P13_004084 [Salmonella enterica]|nr:hypothetical protein [Salmonella enterica]ELE3278935.1 hypothetical protein [Salmonella enterica subsp. enterica serovar Tucson]EGH6761760.1 hypothetical protein [Salmonella enterica]EGK2663542.1 hypothetical protein [Salmonella enterica]EGS1459818.1 hypothetical protein [Salmonella enterica]